MKKNKLEALIPKLGRGAMGLLAGTSLFNAHTALASEPPPNIVFILADDLGWTDINCRAYDENGMYIPGSPATPGGQYDSTFYETPNIARLRSAGMRFTWAYAAFHVCGPSRACILTGKNPARLDMTALPIVQQANTVPPFGRPNLPHEEVTIAEALKAAPNNLRNNYISSFIGKWHLAGDYMRYSRAGYDFCYPSRHAYWPSAPQNGFDFGIYNNNVNHISGNYWEQGYTWMDRGWHYEDRYDGWDTYNLHGLTGPYDHKSLWGDPDPNKGDEYLTDSYALKAEAFLDKWKLEYEKKGRPFFLYLSHVAVHGPTAVGTRGPPKESKLQAHERYIKYFDQRRKADNRHNSVVYAAMIKSLDDSVGSIMTKLRELGVAENTVIVFTSDNGGFETKESLLGYPELPRTDNHPLRFGKTHVYEGGLRVPLIVYWPGHTKPNSTCDVPVFGADFFPTFLEMAGMDMSQLEDAYQGFDPSTIDGTSIVSLLEGRTFTRQNDSDDHLDDGAIFWHCPVSQANPKILGDAAPASVVLKDGYKLIKFYDKPYKWGLGLNHFAPDQSGLRYDAPGRFELYNLQDNIKEKPKYNLYTNNQDAPLYDTSRQLKNLLENWLQKVNAGMMRPRVRNHNTGNVFRNIQAAINKARNGETVVVWPGVHLEALSLAGKNIILRSLNPNDPQIVNNTVLHANARGSTVTFAPSNNAKCVLSGFTITGGRAENGGGINGNGARATIANCIIRDNSAKSNGGGIHSFNGTISNCTITNNSAGNTGGGIADCSAAIANCLIAQNDAANNGGGLSNCHDGAVINSTIAHNIAPGGAGLNKCTSAITNCIIWGNFQNQLQDCVVPSYSCIQDWIGTGEGNIKADPLFANSYEFYDTTKTQLDHQQYFFKLFSVADVDGPRTNYAVSDIIELANDGVIRRVTHIDNKSNMITFSPPLSPSVQENTSVYNWGVNARNVIEDYHLQADSPCIDKGIDSTETHTVVDIDGELRLQGVNIDMGSDEVDPSQIQREMKSILLRYREI
ncbi:MAG: sulfatase-like hydrolase/transferase [Planctomycetota bacterium]|jgi:arylsulfatase A-like enzyme